MVVVNGKKKIEQERRPDSFFTGIDTTLTKSTAHCLRWTTLTAVIEGVMSLAPAVVKIGRNSDVVINVAQRSAVLGSGIGLGILGMFLVAGSTAPLIKADTGRSKIVSNIISVTGVVCLSRVISGVYNPWLLLSSYAISYIIQHTTNYYYPKENAKKQTAPLGRDIASANVYNNLVKKLFQIPIAYSVSYYFLPPAPLLFLAVDRILDVLCLNYFVGIIQDEGFKKYWADPVTVTATKVLTVTVGTISNIMKVVDGVSDHPEFGDIVLNFVGEFCEARGIATIIDMQVAEKTAAKVTDIYSCLPNLTFASIASDANQAIAVGEVSRLNLDQTQAVRAR